VINNINNMRYLKLFENFEQSKTREELIEDLISTSTFEREELESMTDDELEEVKQKHETSCVESLSNENLTHGFKMSLKRPLTNGMMP
jgi:hypothetical protein